MEKQALLRETFKIVKDGVFFKVYNDSYRFNQLFTEYSKAEQFIENYIRTKNETEFLKAVRRLRKIKDLKLRCRKYRELCQVYKK